MVKEIRFKEIEFQKLSLKPHDMIIFYLPRGSFSQLEADQIIAAFKRDIPAGIAWVALRTSEKIKIQKISSMEAINEMGRH